MYGRMSFLGVGISGTRSLPEAGYVQGGLSGEGGRYVQGVGTHPLLLKPSRSHHMNGRQVGSMHPTCMHSCFNTFNR